MLLQWFSQHSITFQVILAYIPLIATVATTILSIVLARATRGGHPDVLRHTGGAWRHPAFQQL